MNRSKALFWLTVKDQGPRTGVTEGFSLSALDFVEGGGTAGRTGGPWIADLNRWIDEVVAYQRQSSDLTNDDGTIETNSMFFGLQSHQITKFNWRNT